MKITTFLVASLTLIAFATNSILCRLALYTDAIGPLAFTAIRLAAGIVILLPLVFFRDRWLASDDIDNPGDADFMKVRWPHIWPALALFWYAIFFSLAYVQLDAAVGALILFPTVQISMIGISMLQGNRISLIESFGFAISLSGLICLMLPGVTAPPLWGTVMMIASGVSWAAYSLLGMQQVRPILGTARNFLFCLPAVVVLGLIVALRWFETGNPGVTTTGVGLAVLSGSVASGVGYVLWYLTVRRISATLASISQLAVPVLAAAGGVIFLNESLTSRLVIASAMILGGIAIAILGRKPVPLSR